MFYREPEKVVVIVKDNKKNPLEDLFILLIFFIILSIVGFYLWNYKENINNIKNVDLENLKEYNFDGPYAFGKVYCKYETENIDNLFIDIKNSGCYYNITFYKYRYYYYYYLDIFKKN